MLIAEYRPCASRVAVTRSPYPHLSLAQAVHHVPPPERTTDDWLFELVASAQRGEVTTIRVASAPASVTGCSSVVWGCKVDLGADIKKVGQVTGTNYSSPLLNADADVRLDSSCAPQVIHLAPYHGHGTIALLQREGSEDGTAGV
jgi:hypothetical protein